MIVSLFYVILAILGLSFLIFIHELGHYWMARRVGMKVDTFSIGFGKPIFSWLRDGVKWQIGWLPFGGYVKIAGMENESDPTISPYDIPDGFYGKTPWQRIKVAFMGPFTNLVFAFLLFGLLWSLGGRDKNFAEVTSKIGWVDPKSELFATGIRPGDEVASYDGHTFKGLKDHVYAAITGVGDVTIQGYKASKNESEKKPFEVNVKGYQNPFASKKGFNTLGILAPANYIIYDRMPNGAENPLPEGSPLINSGLQYGDRLVWADGEVIYSSAQLESILNDHKALLTIQRDDNLFLARVARLSISELKLDPQFKEELIDWQFEADLKSTKIQQLLALPYNLTNDGVVENPLKFIDKDYETEAFPTHSFDAFDEPLKVGDKIVAVDGTPVTKASEIFKVIQSHKVNIIVQRNPSTLQKDSWKQADFDFDRNFKFSELQKITQTIGTNKIITSANDFHLLKSVSPKTVADFERTPEKDALRVTDLLAKQKEIDSIQDPEKRALQNQLLKQYENRLLLGLPHQDLRVSYNPPPLEMFFNVVEEIWRTLGSLLTGAMSAEWLSGPVGIVQVVHNNWMIGIKEALYWIAAISVNLGMLNLLPIPVLDGGTILLSFIEMITRKRANPKVLEWVVLPFAALLVMFFIFVTYHDIARIFGK
ncbi:MAG: site-2 protease family protein [Parachlamydiaceae bacterium]|nr:site-2 protease family protein [Parachlamydiaceae bacterium]